MPARFWVPAIRWTDLDGNGHPVAMEVQTHEDLREFWEIAGPLYLADPVRHTLALTGTRRLLETSDLADQQPVLLTLWEGCAVRRRHVSVTAVADGNKRVARARDRAGRPAAARG